MGVLAQTNNALLKNAKSIKKRGIDVNLESSISQRPWEVTRTLRNMNICMDLLDDISADKNKYKGKLEEISIGSHLDYPHRNYISYDDSDKSLRVVLVDEMEVDACFLRLMNITKKYNKKPFSRAIKSKYSVDEVDFEYLAGLRSAFLKLNSLGVNVSLGNMASVNFYSSAGSSIIHLNNCVDSLSKKQISKINSVNVNSHLGYARDNVFSYNETDKELNISLLRGYSIRDSLCTKLDLDL